MYYKVENGILNQTKLDEISVDDKILGILNVDELERSCKKLNIDKDYLDIISKKTSYLRNRFEIYENYSIAIISIINKQKKNNRLAMYINKNSLIITLLEDTDNYASGILSECINNYNNEFYFEKFIVTIFNRMVASSVEIIEKYEDAILKIEDKIVNKKVNVNINNDIFKIRKILSEYLKYYKSLMTIVEMLIENNNEILDENRNQCLNILDTRLERIKNDIEFLIEDLVHVQDLYGASLDYAQNKTMEIFTVVTTIFLPLTLITGWYGMNFKYMPELDLKYGYFGVIGVSILIILICIYFFKKNKLM